MAEHILGKDEVQVRFLLGAPNYGVISVMEAPGFVEPIAPGRNWYNPPD
jgi:hypothetical protein